MKLYAVPFYVERYSFPGSNITPSPILSGIILAKSMYSRESSYAMCKVVKEIAAICVQKL
jgi:hypothetical protein